MENSNLGKFEGKVLEKLENIENQLNKKVDYQEFKPVKAIAYGMVSLILVAVIGAVIGQVVKAFIK